MTMSPKGGTRGRLGLGLMLVAAVLFVLGSSTTVLAHHKTDHAGGPSAGGGGGAGKVVVTSEPQVADAGDNAHPSGKDRSVESGGSGTQGKSGSDPDANSNGGKDKPAGVAGLTGSGGPGGVDLDDQDGNNGCGNDDDFEDDNNGNCRGKAKPAQPTAPTVTAPTAAVAPTAVAGVLGEQVSAGGQGPGRAKVLGESAPRAAPAAAVAGELAFTGYGVLPILLLIGGLTSAGLISLSIARRRARRA